MPKVKKPESDGAVLLTIFNPYGMPSSYGSILMATEYDRGQRLEMVTRWIRIMGITISELFAKRTEKAIIVDVRDTKDPVIIDRVIGMHKWSEFLDPCPEEFESEVSHIYRCTSTSLEHLELTLGFDMVFGFDKWIKPPGWRIDDIFANPYPTPKLPTDWPREEGPMGLYIRPKAKARRVAPAEVDDFLSGIDFPFDEPKPKRATSSQPPSIPLGSMDATKVEQMDAPLAATLDVSNKGEPNDDMILLEARFETEEEGFFKKLNAHVSKRLALSNPESPLKDMKPDIREDLKIHCKHEDSKSGITSDLDRKPCKKELDELDAGYHYSSAIKKEEQEELKALLPVKRGYDDEDTRGEPLGKVL